MGHAEEDEISGSGWHRSMTLTIIFYLFSLNINFRDYMNLQSGKLASQAGLMVQFLRPPPL